MKGYAEISDENAAKNGDGYVIKGHDVLGLFATDMITEGKTFENQTLSSIVNDLIKGRTHINRSDFRYGTVSKLDSKSKLKSLADVTFPYVQLSPGQTRHEVLASLCAEKGWLFFAMPDGTIAITEPARSGEPVFTLDYNKTDGQQNTASNRRVIQDFSRQFSDVTVTGQVQGSDSWGAGEQNVSATATRNFSIKRSFVQHANLAGSDAKALASRIMTRQRFEGYRRMYTVPGHSQNGRNYQVNALIKVNDQVDGFKGNMLIIDRAFSMSKDETSTHLILARPEDI